MNKAQDLLWVEKYRPSTIDDCILTATNEKTFKEIIKSSTIPNMLLTGVSGCGKTTVARALCDELDVDSIFINASEESGIDTLRNKIRNFASTVSMHGGRKVIILDEADHLNPASTQPALRGAIEEFAANCRFIFTANYKNKLIPALHSRCTEIQFQIPSKEKPKIAGKFMERAMYVLKSESVKLKSPEIIAELIKKYYPDFRRVLNELQRYSMSGEVDEGILTVLSEVETKKLMDALKNKQFTTMRKWVVENMDQEPSRIFRKLYDNLYAVLEPGSIPQAVLIIANYDYRSAFVGDAEINLVACLAEIMVDCEFK
ncbi:TPA: DNA polymerase [Candidatus Poribacteria bacterium]|nr:DNA polymerase [Candidatus Poribacteria bacterium]